MADPHSLLKSLRGSHDRLTLQVRAFGPSDLEKGSYCSEWSVAQVLSHLGSSAEIFSLVLEAGLRGTDPPDQSAFPPVWELWNGRSAQEQASGSVAVNEAFIHCLEELTDDELASFHVQMFGMDIDGAMLLHMRLAEHVVHSWDITVAFDPGARLAPDAVGLLLDGLPMLVQRVGVPAKVPETVAVTTASPSGNFLLRTDGVRLESAGTAATPSNSGPAVQMPAEALIRLVYGRLDDAHLASGEIKCTGVGLDELRALFPGV